MIKTKKKGRFVKMFQELVIDDKELEVLVREKVKLFEKNPDDTRLDNHPLKKRMEGKWAFSITHDIRIVYERIGKNTIRFLAIGGHEEVY